MSKDKYTLLLVDDSEDDRLFMRRAISANPRLMIVGEVGDGDLAIDYLAGRGAFADREKHPLPDAMLLDLKMPRRTGHEVLQWLKAQSFKDLFVAVVSGSFLPEDIALSMAFGANAYFKKNALKEEQEAMLREVLSLLDAALQK
jgi:DNA-binding NarL/FixJ family response regulator